MKAENEMTLTFPSRSANEAFARAAVACFAAQLDPNLEELNDIKTAVSEAVTNCIVHAYRDTIGLVTIRCRILPDSVLDVVVRDKGCGMEDIEKARTPMFTTGGPERQRETLHLKDIEGVPTCEIARMLGCDEAQVRVILSRARHGLREALKKWMDDERTTKTD